MAISSRAKQLLKLGIAKVWNKQFLTFLFFLALSTTFWVFTKLNDTYRHDYEVPIRLVHVPKNVVITSDLPEYIHVSVTDKGWGQLAYEYGGAKNPITVEFATYAGSNGYGSVPVTDLSRQILAQLPAGASLSGLRPQSLEFYFNYGERKRVPVRFKGDIDAANRYYISYIHAVPDSVTVYARRSILDTLTAVTTKGVYLRNVSDTTTMNVELQSIPGVKFIPNRVKLKIGVDRLVEKTVQVPVQQVNFPASKVLRTFPSKVNVTFQVGMAMYKQITSDSFVLVINYEDLLNNPTPRCHLKLKTIPTGIRQVRISPSDVEYVIEEIPATDE